MTKGVLGSWGIHPSSQLFIIMFPWVILVKTHLFDLRPENDLFNDLMTKDCLFALCLFKNYVHLIMLGLDAVIIWGSILDLILIKQL